MHELEWSIHLPYTLTVPMATTQDIASITGQPTALAAIVAGHPSALPGAR